MAEPITENAYAVLGVPPESDDHTVAVAYRAMARRYHPDHVGEAGTGRMILVNAAFDRLRTPQKRAEYDLELERTSGIPRPRRASRASAPRPEVRRAAPAARPVEHVPRRERDGTGGAGPPPGRPSGSVLGFGRHIGWSIGEVVRVDPGYLVWLEERREGRPYLDEIDRVLRAAGYRNDSNPAATRGKGRRT